MERSRVARPWRRPAPAAVMAVVAALAWPAPGARAGGAAGPDGRAPAAGAQASAAAAAASGGASSAPSEAETLLFVQQHLAALQPPRTLRYRFVQDGLPPGHVEDDVTMALTAGPDGHCCHVRGTYLTGPALRLPDIEQARSNPVLLYFLEHQIRQLNQRTGGTANHFRQRIRRALADEATVEPVTVRWNGRDVPARSVRITPYASDPYRERFARDAGTVYRFVLSEAVPGGVYQLSAALPDGGAHQTLTLAADAGERAPERR